ncbi:MAG: SDR family NAD(P)-dependent oxidoreductase [Caulobacterales bacterium]|uniref:SDR family NAD(P)-dependent oxidoreductase n=1 Tax=Glycocaulis sp. TaxID=1969725 RepID=UPI003FA12562
MARRLVVITGASSGIGAAFAREFASKGWDLALVARREDRLRELAEEMKARFGVDSLIIPADLAKATAPKEIVKAVEDAGRQIDGLVNNAGAGQPGFFVDTKWTDQTRFLQLMVTNYLALAHLVAPGMAERGFGRIINVSSVSALLPSANAHTRFSGTLYPGAKSLLIKFSEALHLELSARNVHVTAVAPGYTWSEFHDVNGARQTVSSLPKFWMLTAEEVAIAGYDAVERGIVLRVPGAWYKFLTAFSKILPDPVGRAIMRAQEKRMAAQAGASQ